MNMNTSFAGTGHAFVLGGQAMMIHEYHTKGTLLTKPDILWHKVEDGLPELPTDSAIFECLAFVPGGEHGGMVVPCDFYNQFDHDGDIGPAFYRVEQAENGDRETQERIDNATHWAVVKWPEET